METLTPKEEKIFNFIEKYQMKFGSSPTVREMREHMKLKSDGFIVHCMKSLQKKGYIEKDDTPRGIKLLKSVAERLHSNVVKIPMLGYIPAGGPIATEENVEDWVSFDAAQFKDPTACFILRVVGDSMIDAGINDGDYVVASTKIEPKVRDIVVALVDGGSTVKRFLKDKAGQTYLKPENERYSDIFPEDDLQIQGVVIGLFRWY